HPARALSSCTGGNPPRAWNPHRRHHDESRRPAGPEPTEARSAATAAGTGRPAWRAEPAAEAGPAAAAAWPGRTAGRPAGRPAPEALTANETERPRPSAGVFSCPPRPGRWPRGWQSNRRRTELIRGRRILDGARARPSLWLRDN